MTKYWGHKRSFGCRSSADDASLTHIAEAALARPTPSVWKAQLYARKVLLIGQAHIDAHLDVAELRYGAGGQDEVGRESARQA